MGISLEYGEGSPPSQRGSRSSRSPSGGQIHLGYNYQQDPSASPRSHGTVGELTAPLSLEEDYEHDSVDLADEFPSAIPLFNSNSRLNAKKATDKPPLPQEIPHHAQRQTVHPTARPVIVQPEALDEDILHIPDVEEEMPVLRSALSKPPMLAILDRWRKASKSRQIHKVPSQPLLDDEGSPAIKAEHFQEPAPLKIGLDVSSPKLNALSLAHQRETIIVAESKTPVVKKSPLTVSATHDRLATPREHAQRNYGDYTAMLHRASRAREIYLASKAFNHWVERTAARLEKEAVARRHMIRFRCFRAWSNTPNARSPAVDNLRAATAVQKLRRAVACQEEQLRAAASAIYETHRVQKAKRAMCQWLCITAQQNIQREKAYRAKRGIVSLWSNLARTHQKCAESTAKSRQDCQKRRLIQHWANQTQQAERQCIISKHVGLVRPMFAHLAAWWDHTEVQKRAEIYRANLVWKKAHSALDTWSLRTRAQACVWRADFQSATCALNKWTQVITNGKKQERRTAFAIEQCKAPAALNRVDHFVDYMNKLECYAQRARLFIMASKFLRVLDHAHEAKRAARKEEVRQQLRARYKEVSSARKKRQFHSALNAWRSSAQRHAVLASEAKDHADALDQTKKLEAVRTWVNAADQHEIQHATGQKHAINHVLDNWRGLSNELTEQDAQSWDMWMQRKQKQILKSWSISSLQGSGQAHTAAMVQQRYESDKRNRTFQAWRHSSRGTEPTQAGYASATPGPSSFNGRRSWRIPSTRMSTIKHETTPHTLTAFNTPAAPVDTPTRWTGRPLAMPSTLAKPMPPVTEADEQSAAASTVSDEMEFGHDLAANTKNPQHGFHRSLVLRAGKMASTTPRAPVPQNLRRSIQVRNPAFYKPTASTPSERPVQPRRPIVTRQGTNDRKPVGYVDSAIQTGIPARFGSPSQGTPAWRSPATPSRQSVGKTASREVKTQPSNWTDAGRTVHQSSRAPYQVSRGPQAAQYRTE